MRGVLSLTPQINASTFIDKNREQLWIYKISITTSAHVHYYYTHVWGGCLFDWVDACDFGIKLLSGAWRLVFEQWLWWENLIWLLGYGKYCRMMPDDGKKYKQKVLSRSKTRRRGANRMRPRVEATTKSAWRERKIVSSRQTIVKALIDRYHVISWCLCVLGVPFLRRNYLYRLFSCLLSAVIEATIMRMKRNLIYIINFHRSNGTDSSE